MDILITKTVDDPRESRGSKLKAGTLLTVEDNDMWRELIKSKKAKENPRHVERVILKNSEEAENFNIENKE